MELVRGLLDHGAQINARDSGGWGALMPSSLVGLPTNELTEEEFEDLGYRARAGDFETVLGAVKLDPRLAANS